MKFTNRQTDNVGVLPTQDDLHQRGKLTSTASYPKEREAKTEDSAKVDINKPISNTSCSPGSPDQNAQENQNTPHSSMNLHKSPSLPKWSI